MSCYGFNFRALYYLDIEELFEVVKVIRGDEDAAGIAPDKDVYIRGVIIPFFRRVGKAPMEAPKEMFRKLLRGKTDEEEVDEGGKANGL